MKSIRENEPNLHRVQEHQP